MLDAKDCSTKFWCSVADDLALCETSEDLHSCASHEEGGIRAVSRVQRDSVGQFDIT